MSETETSSSTSQRDKAMRFLTNTLQMLRSAKGNRRTGSTAPNRFPNQLRIEQLEERRLMTFNDPDYATLQWGLDNIGQNGGTYDVDIDAPEAWTVTTGSMKTLLAQMDSGVDYTHADIYLNISLNQYEIPVALRAGLADTDSDGSISFRDLNSPANAGNVSDLNGTGYIDGGDLLRDSRWANGVDNDGNGLIDDLIGWDFVDNDNDPMKAGNDDHGTRMTQWIGAIPNNGLGYVGVNWFISVMPIRIIRPGTREIDPPTGAAGLDYSIARGASIAGLWGGGYTFSQVLYDAIGRARLAGQLVVAPIGNDATNTDLTPRYPASFDLDNIISVTSFNATDGMDPAWNWGLTTVDLASPTIPGGGTSGGAAHVAAVAALIKTIHPEWNYQQLKARILSTVEPSVSLVGKSVTGGRLNAANALGYAWPATKFFVVNDATYDQTYEYQATHPFITANGLDAGNTAPRGAASTALGTKVWVVDANKKVYIYDTNGASLGSWTAGSLASNATVEGMTTDGTNVWIVDAMQDKVFRYTNATPLSGSQNAASSFSLNNGNKNPKDIVTDGTYLWVVNDSSSTDKVFKYTLTGTLVASWTISTPGATTPTGITLDPSKPDHLWIVDSGTDRVYEYSNAVNQANGSSVSAPIATSFALAAGNTNPQGIADPPPQGSQPATGTPAVPGRGSAESAYAPPAVASMSWSPLKKVTSELSVQESSLRGEFTGSRESDNLDGRSFELGLSKKPATKRLGDVFGQRDQIHSNDIAGGPDLDDLFADWSADPLQLLLSNGR